MRYGPKNLRITFTAKTLSHFGGVYLLYQFLTKLGLKSRIAHDIHLIQRNHRYSLSDMLLALVYPMMLGLDRIETTYLLRRNGVFQYLTGLPSYPNPTALRRFLLRINPQALREVFQLAGYSGDTSLISSSFSQLSGALRFCPSFFPAFL